MPLSTSGAKKPLPLSQCILHLERARLAAKKARRVENRLRANDQQRTEEAYRLLAELIDGADVVAQAETGALWHGRTIFLLVSLAPDVFTRLCEYGGDPHLEGSTDAEPVDYLRTAGGAR